MVAETRPVDFLVVEDEPVCRSLFVDLLAEEGHGSVVACADGREALRHLRERSFDVVLTDLNMPALNGQSLIAEALRLYPHLTVLVVSGHATPQGAVQLLKDGAYDFLSKPFGVEDFKRMVEGALSRVRGRAETGLSPVLASLLAALERKDVYLKGHSERVASMAASLAGIAGVSGPRVELLREIAAVHDVGKIGVSERVLNKPGPLTPAEWDEVRRHPIHTVEILRPLPELADGIPFALHHHERYDGRGYPAGLTGEDTPIEARVIAIADTFDAMHSDRAYRKALPMEEIASRLRRARGAQLDPDLTDLFLINMAAIAALEANR